MRAEKKAKVAIVCIAAAVCVCAVVARAQSGIEDTVRDLVKGFAAGLADDLDSAEDIEPLAVLDFNVTNPEGFRNIGKLAAGELETELADTGEFLLADRSHVSSVLTELNLDRTGITSADSARRMGKLSGVNSVLLGHIFIGAGNIVVILRLVDIQSGRELWMDRRSGGFREEIGYLDESLDKIMWIEAAGQAGVAALHDLMKKKLGGNVKTVAVGSLRNISGYGFTGFEDFTTDVITEALFNGYDYSVVERQYLDDLFKEKTFEKSGMVDIDRARDMMGMLSVDALLVGDIKVIQSGTRSDIYGKNRKVTVEARVNLKLIDINNGLMLAAGRGEKVLGN